MPSELNEEELRALRAAIASLHHIYVVEGRPMRPMMSAEMMRTLVLAAGHEIVVEEMSATRCRVAGRRRGGQQWSTVEWTIADAERARLNSRSNWQRYPRRMLAARATGELCRILFADAIAPERAG